MRTSRPFIFRDRVDAGKQLAERLGHLRGRDVVVLGLTRGGVPVAFQVAEALEAPLDVIVVRKVGLPFQPELAMGALGEGGFEVVDRGLVARAGVTPEEWRAVEQHERAELERQTGTFRAGREPWPVRGRVAVVVDDGIATGATARVACEVARHLGATKVVLAVPVAPSGAERNMTGGDGADEVVCVATPQHLGSVGQYYADFSATADSEVTRLLQAADRWRGTREVSEPEQDVDLDVEVPSDGVTLPGHLRCPPHAAGVVLFAHGSGSSRHSPRNRFVASVLHRRGLGTLLLDLLTPSEEHDRARVFDIELLTARLVDATRWLLARPDTAAARCGYFGASTGAAAALSAAATLGPSVSAVVSRGGRPDLAWPQLPRVTAPTLLIVGSRDPAVLELNRQAQARLRCPHRLSVVRGATHLFEEPGTLEQVAGLAGDWFAEHLLASGADRAAARSDTPPRGHDRAGQ